MTTYGIAVGHDDADPTALHLLSGELFWRYEGSVPDEWYQSREIAGDLTTRLTGKPRIVWRLNLSQSEVDYLLDNIFTADTVELTIWNPDRATTEAPPTRFNVLGRWLDMRDGSSRYLDNGFWYDATLEFIVVEQLIEPP